MKIEDKRKRVFELMERSNVCKFKFDRSECMFYVGIKAEKTIVDDEEVYNVWNISTDLYKQLKDEYVDMIIEKGISFTSDKLRYERYKSKRKNIEDNLASDSYTSYARKIAISTVENLKKLMDVIEENRKKDADFFVIN
jgi:hypothetical protein